jgi:hypothetical protein
MLGNRFSALLLWFAVAITLNASLPGDGACAPAEKAANTEKTVNTDAVRAIAKEAWLYAYAPLQGYQTLYSQALNKESSGFVGGFNRFRHYSRLSTPADTDIVTPNNDTPYSWAWLDLRAEPIVVSLPAVPAPRYYVNQWFDLYTHNFAYTGVRATGRAAGNYLFAGPNWKGEIPPNITAVFRAETEIVGTLTRTQLDGESDREAMQRIQAQYQISPLSKFLGVPAPPALAPISLPAWDKAAGEGIGFIAYLNALLPYMPTVPSEKAAFERFAAIGIGAGKRFDPAALPPAIRTAIEAGVADAVKLLRDTALAQKDSKQLFGTRAELADDYVMRRALGAMLGIYGNSKEEAIYGSQQTDAAGQVLDGNKRWVLRFEPGQLPPVDIFWSITMYRLPERFLVENKLNRYSLGDRSPSLKPGADGSLEIYLQSQEPSPDKIGNWLPTPQGPFFFVARFYGPKAALIDGTWSLPSVKEIR